MGRELERRSRDVAEGRVQTISWETARTEILRNRTADVRLELHPEAQAELAARHSGTTRDVQD